MGSGIGEPGQESRLSHSLPASHHFPGPSANNRAFEDLLIIGYHKSVLSTIKCCTDNSLMQI